MEMSSRQKENYKSEALEGDLDQKYEFEGCQPTACAECQETDQGLRIQGERIHWGKEIEPHGLCNYTHTHTHTHTHIMDDELGDKAVWILPLSFAIFEILCQLPPPLLTPFPLSTK